jgi:hypothetical protein
MRTKKSKNSKLGILLLLPVFLIYVNHSLLIYHSHILSNGTVITHAHSLNDCESKQLPGGNNHPAKKQIIVFQGLMFVLNDHPLPVFSIENESDFFVKISLPLIHIKCAGFFRHKPGRAPPAFFS